MSDTRIGDMRTRVTFQEPVKEADEYGGNIVTWSNVVTIWAKLEPLSGREYFWAQQIKVDISHKIITRFRTGLSEKMRILHADGRVFFIDSVIDKDERHRWLEILCHQEKPA